MISSWVSLIFKLNWTFSISVTSHLVLTLSILCRWISSNHFPLSNLHESLIFLAWIFSLLCVSPIVPSETTPELPPTNRGALARVFDMRALNSNVAKNPVGILAKTPKEFLAFVSSPRPATQGPELGGPVLVSSTRAPEGKVAPPVVSWKQQHKRAFNPRSVLVVIFSPIVVLLVGFGEFLLPSAMTKPMPLVPALQSNWLLMHVSTMLMSYGALISGCLLAFAYLLSNTQALQTFFDQLSYRMLALGFPLLTLGILSGSIWANASWGSFWSWDPKETWALANWIIFAIYLHSRFVKGWQGSKPAIIACFGFFTLLICFLGVNVLGKGLHNYSF